MTDEELIYENTNSKLVFRGTLIVWVSKAGKESDMYFTSISAAKLILGINF